MGRHERVYKRRRETADELSRGVNSFCHIQWVMSHLESIFLEHLQSLYKKPDAYQPYQYCVWVLVLLKNVLLVTKV